MAAALVAERLKWRAAGATSPAEAASATLESTLKVNACDLCCPSPPQMSSDASEAPRRRLAAVCPPVTSLFESCPFGFVAQTSVQRNAGTRESRLRAFGFFSMSIMADLLLSRPLFCYSVHLVVNTCK